MLEKKIRILEAEKKEKLENVQIRMLADLKTRLKEKEQIAIARDRRLRGGKDVMAILYLIRERLIREIGRCEKCHTTSFPLTLDHIIPKFVLWDFGINADTYVEEGNFRLLCKPCNMLKSNHLDFTDPRTKPLLLGLLSKIPTVKTEAETAPEV
jgi:5-methylcytosine-specific restriction endonuclease McrA